MISRLSAECIRPLCYIPLMGCWLFPLPFPNSHPQEKWQGQFRLFTQHILGSIGVFLILGSNPMGTVGFEPTTPRSSILCSTSWSYIPKVVPTGFEPVCPDWKSGILTLRWWDLDCYNRQGGTLHRQCSNDPNEIWTRDTSWTEMRDNHFTIGPWSGLRDSNSWHQPWQGCVLPLN